MHRLLWLLALTIFLYMVVLPLTLEAQTVLVVSLLVLVTLMSSGSRYVAQHGKLMPLLRIGIILLAAFVTLRYFYWRTTTTIEYNDLVSFSAAIALYLAEVYGITVCLLGAFVNVFPLHRKSAPLPDDPEQLPSVDIMIPTYNESPEMLEVTLLAATQVAYPREKLTVYLLDDGGTVEKRNDPDPETARRAHERYTALMALTERVGARYLTREHNDHAKAGNVNAALSRTNGELILILDADHIPAWEILHKTVGFFLQDPKLFLVQTPHFFINPDPIERNLDTYDDMPSENEMFYSVVQHGLDFWGGSFFCGSAALLRRSCLEEIGGISGETITEDAETALTLHARGYHSVYLGEPLISGLQPETFSGFVMQRVRWAQGMVQLFLLKNPLMMQGLTLPQRLAYISSSFFWFFPFARIIFMLAPAAFLLFGFHIYSASVGEFLVYALPHVVALTMLSNFLYGKTRWPFVSELYETMQSLFSLGAILKVFRNPRAPTFLVTPKGERLDEDFVSSLATPFYILIAITAGCLIAAAIRITYYPEQAEVAMITGGWALFNLMLLIGALGALFERRQRRTTPRVHIPVELPGAVYLSGNVVDCQIFDISVTGAGFVTDCSLERLPEEGSEIELVVDNHGLGQLTSIPCVVRRVFERKPHLSWLDRLMRRRVPLAGQKKSHYQVGLEFRPVALSDQRAIVALVFGDAEMLSSNLVRRQQQRGVFSALGFLLTHGLYHSFKHLAHLLAGLRRVTMNSHRTTVLGRKSASEASIPR